MARRHSQWKRGVPVATARPEAAAKSDYVCKRAHRLPISQCRIHEGRRHYYGCQRREPGRNDRTPLYVSGRRSTGRYCPMIKQHSRRRGKRSHARRRFRLRNTLFLLGNPISVVRFSAGRRGTQGVANQLSHPIARSWKCWLVSLADFGIYIYGHEDKLNTSQTLRLFLLGCLYCFSKLSDSFEVG